jgi:hypothetical protein
LIEDHRRRALEMPTLAGDAHEAVAVDDVG